MEEAEAETNKHMASLTDEVTTARAHISELTYYLAEARRQQQVLEDKLAAATAPPSHDASGNPLPAPVSASVVPGGPGAAGDGKASGGAHPLVRASSERSRMGAINLELEEEVSGL